MKLEKSAYLGYTIYYSQYFVISILAKQPFRYQVTQSFFPEMKVSFFTKFESFIFFVKRMMLYGTEETYSSKIQDALQVIMCHCLHFSFSVLYSFNKTVLHDIRSETFLVHSFPLTYLHMNVILKAVVIDRNQCLLFDSLFCTKAIRMKASSHSTIYT